MEERVADAIVQTLQGERVEVVFGICGGYLFWLMKAFEDAAVRTIPSRHEGAAAFAAAGYAQASGRLGVVFGQGPGAANTITGVAAAYYDSTPMLVIGAQAPQDHYCADAHQEATGSNHGVDQIAMFEPLTRIALRCPSPGSALRTLRRALAVAHAERGPAFIEFPVNVLCSEIEPELLPPERYRAVSHSVDVAGIADTAELIAKAKRPVLLLGNRASHRGLGDEVRALCEEANLPVAVMDYAKGLVAEDHPLYAGIVGWCGHEAAHEYLESSDLVVAIGCRFDTKSTLNFKRSMFENLVQIDELPSEIGRNLPIRLGLVGDVPASVRALRGALRQHGAERPARAWMRELHRKHATYAEPLAKEATVLSSPALMHVLRQRLPREALVVGDSGLNLHYLKRFFPVYSSDGFFCLYGWAAMGSALPVAMGVQVARPKDVVACVIGDGGFLVYTGELQGIVEANLPLIVVVLNNAGYQGVGRYMDKLMGSAWACGIEEIDAAKIAQGFGCDGYTARTQAELARAIDSALERRRPSVIDVKVVGDKLEDVMLPSVEKFVRERIGGK